MKQIYLLLLSLLCLLGLGAFSSQGTEISVIVHKDNPVATLSAGETKLYWLRKIKKRWPEINKNIKPADRKTKCPEQETFYSKVLNMTGTDVEAYFTQKQYESAEKPQDKFTNDAAIIGFVAEEPGAIGYVSSGSLSADDKSKVKVVLTIP